MSKLKAIVLVFCVIFISIGIRFGMGVYSETRTYGFGGTHDTIPTKNRLQDDCCQVINTKGLSDLKAYGSGSINYLDFKEIFKGQKNNIHVVNLLSDDMYYYQDRCLRWYGLGYMKHNLGQHFFVHKPFKWAYRAMIRLIYGTPPTHDPSLLQTEREIVQDLGGHYYLPLKGIEDWLGNQSYVEDVIKIFESMPEDAYLYAHCAHGRGRTTTILVFYDIFRNGKTVSLRDIANRHYCLGREDVLNTTLWKKGTWSQGGLNARKDLVERFYAFMTDPQGYGHQSWTQWNQGRGGQPLQPIMIHRE